MNINWYRISFINRKFRTSRTTAEQNFRRRELRRENFHGIAAGVVWIHARQREGEKNNNYDKDTKNLNSACSN